MKILPRPMCLAYIGFVLCFLSAPVQGSDIFCGLKSHHQGKVRGAFSSGGGVLYTPVAAAAPTTVTAVVSTVEQNPLATAHAAEVAMVRQERAKAALKAEIEASNRILQRIASAGDCSNCPKPTGDPSEIQRQLEALKEMMLKIDTRLTVVEKVLLTHDSFLQDMSKNNAIPKAKAPQ